MFPRSVSWSQLADRGRISTFQGEPAKALTLVKRPLLATQIECHFRDWPGAMEGTALIGAHSWDTTSLRKAMARQAARPPAPNRLYSSSI